MEEFHSSIGFDQRLAAVDIRGSIAHARMLGKVGIITPAEAESLIQGLEGSWRMWRRGRSNLTRRPRISI